MIGGGKRKEVEKATESLDFSKNKYQVVLKTSEGDIKLDLWPDVAPNHCKNLLGLAKIGFYNGLTFHRIIEGFVIQGGCPAGSGSGGPGYNVDAEFNEKKHEAGVLSMARASDPNSAGSQFFLCLDKVPYLDQQYTGFGKTADEASLEVVRKIGAVETDAHDKPLKPVVINSVAVVENPL